MHMVSTTKLENLG